MAFATSDLSQENILRDVHDPVAQTLRTTATAVITGGTIEVIISDTTDSIKIGDGTGDYLEVNDDGSINTVNVSSLVPFKFDGIYPSYPTAIQEIYVYKQGATTVATVTVNYVDASKNQIVSVVRT